MRSPGGAGDDEGVARAAACGWQAVNARAIRRTWRLTSHATVRAVRRLRRGVTPPPRKRERGRLQPACGGIVQGVASGRGGGGGGSLMNGHLAIARGGVIEDFTQRS